MEHDRQTTVQNEAYPVIFEVNCGRLLRQKLGTELHFDAEA
jgi:hypothetical protein